MRQELEYKVCVEVDKWFNVDLTLYRNNNFRANIVPVRNQTGQKRVCIDFRDLNGYAQRTISQYRRPKWWLTLLYLRWFSRLFSFYYWLRQEDHKKQTAGVHPSFHKSQAKKEYKQNFSDDWRSDLTGRDLSHKKYLLT